MAPSLLSIVLRVVLAAVLAVSASPTASGFDRTEKHPSLGFSLDRPSKFEARPLPPGMEGLELIYAPKDAPVDRRSPVTHAVFRVEVDDASDVQRWTLAMFRPSELEAVRSVRKRYGRSPVRYEGKFFDDEGNERSLFVHAWVADGDAVIFVGECEPTRLRREKRTFDRVAMSFRFFTEAEVDEDRLKWERHYRRTSLGHRDERIRVASELVEGWAIEDTAHSMILYHGPKDSPVLAQFARNLVTIRKRFARDLPPDRPIDALSVVRICRDRGEYLTYGGNPTTVGDFNARSQELVLYDARTDREGPMPDDHPTMRTLYHEACHQFLYHTASALSPHSWFDEGTAEYYGGAVLQSGVVKEIVGLEARDQYIARPEVLRRLPPLTELLEMTQDEFYADADVNYTMAYALLRFLHTSREAQSNRRWSKLPDTYFETLRATWRRAAEDLALTGITSERYGAAIEASRATALEAALDGIDVADLERAFLAWLRRGQG